MSKPSDDRSAVEITVVIPTYERTDLLARCLDHLERQDLPPGGFEVLVVDDASARPVAPLVAPAYAASRIQIRWLRVEPNSPARARNLGIDEAAGRLILFLGDDILAEPSMLRLHVDEHARQPVNVAVLGRIETHPEARGSAFERYFDPFGFNLLRGDQFVDHKFFWTNNVSLKTSFLRTGGRFDEEFSDAHHEDVELGWRLEQQGLRILFRDVVVGRHLHPYTVESACRLMYGRGRTFHLLRRKVPETVFREHLGIFSWRNSPRHVARSLARTALFNSRTAGAWQAWLAKDRESALRRFFYWKLLAYHTNRGFRDGFAG